MGSSQIGSYYGPTPCVWHAPALTLALLYPPTRPISQAMRAPWLQQASRTPMHTLGQAGLASASGPAWGLRGHSGPAWLRAGGVRWTGRVGSRFDREIQVKAKGPRYQCVRPRRGKQESPRVSHGRDSGCQRASTPRMAHVQWTRRGEIRDRKSTSTSLQVRPSARGSQRQESTPYAHHGTQGAR